MNSIPRITREQMLLEIAHAASRRGTCGRLQVGAVVARDSRAISLGYVGAPSGEPHCSPEVCDSSRPCTRTIHAEQNALRFALRQGISLAGAELFVTDSPCLDCAKMAWLVGISHVFYDRSYRTTDGIDFLKSRGIEVTKVERAPQS